MKNNIIKFLCCIGIHKLEKDEWTETVIEYDNGESYWTNVNYCKRCGQKFEK